MEKKEKQMPEKTTRKAINGAKYLINEKKKAVTCYVVSKGEKIYGYSKCGPHDTFDVERGKEIAAYRCEINQRKRDLRNTEEVIDRLQNIIEEIEYQVYHRFMDRSLVSKHWDTFLRLACEERQTQLDNIHFCEEQIEKLSK